MGKRHTKPFIPNQYFIAGVFLIALVILLILLMNSLTQPIPVENEKTFAANGTIACSTTFTIEKATCGETCRDDIDCMSGFICYKAGNSYYGICRPYLTPEQGCTSSTTPYPTPTSTSCISRPACLDQIPACEIAEPIEGWCPVLNIPTPTPFAVFPNAPSWFDLLPPNLKGFLEQLYLTIFVFQRETNLRHLLNGIVN